jgi:hypothetical protein
MVGQAARLGQNIALPATRHFVIRGFGSALHRRYHESTPQRLKGSHTLNTSFFDVESLKGLTKSKPPDEGHHAVQLLCSHQLSTANGWSNQQTALWNLRSGKTQRVHFVRDSIASSSLGLTQASEKSSFHPLLRDKCDLDSSCPHETSKIPDGVSPPNAVQLAKKDSTHALDSHVRG